MNPDDSDLRELIAASCLFYVDHYPAESNRLESELHSRGIDPLRLETGVKQPRAIGLCRRHGYLGRGPFAFDTYRTGPPSVLMERRARSAAGGQV